MIQNELLPGCAILLDDEEIIVGEYWGVFSISDNKSDRFKPIPLTADTVSRIEGVKEEQLLNDGEPDASRLFLFKNYCDNKVEIELYPDGTLSYVSLDDHVELEHITSVHQLQTLIYSLTGKMPKYEIG